MMPRRRNPTTIGVRPAGQTSAPAQPGPPVDVAPDGRITGVDGMLDQIAAAIGRQVTPMLTRDVLPLLQRDTALQRTVGQSLGQGLGHELRGPAWLLAGSVGVLAVAAWRKPGASPVLPFAAGAGSAIAVCWLLSRK